ncbi:DNA-(apurinic or apyrimidinic site) lyase [Toxocara canis]|uniref:DNA-(Apurinic or apyrimidinic site) lyase n=1 Tax=Toxocara canis TaxID=6265 RepID=A0A0B2VGL8_TOXCA|nr:DNA-(apurinic or apyrimidinic site) lyase [Toxocara canis]
MPRKKRLTKESSEGVVDTAVGGIGPCKGHSSKRSRKSKQTGKLMQQVEDIRGPTSDGKILKEASVKGEPSAKMGVDDRLMEKRHDIASVKAAKKHASKRGQKQRTVKRKLEESESPANDGGVILQKSRGTVAEGSAKGGRRRNVTKVKLIGRQKESSDHENEGAPSGVTDSKSAHGPESKAASKLVATKGRKRRLSADEKKTAAGTEGGIDAKENDAKNAAKKKRKMAEGIGRTEALMANPLAEKVMKAADTSKKMLGAHVSAAGGLENAVYNAARIGCRAFALFLRNQRSWNAKPLEEDVVERFKEAMKECSFPIDQVVPHGSYLINAGSADKEVLQKSRQAMLDECQRCERLGIHFYNIHPGSAAGKYSAAECIQTVAESINYVLERTSSIIIVVETMAGQGSTVGGTFEELRSIIDQVDKKERIGVCIDTCHIFAAGYDIRTEETYKKTMEDFGKIVGFNYLKAIHLNDSKGGLGSRLDRHENIGCGKLRSAFKYLMSDERLDGIPMVLETPEGDYAAEIIRLYSKAD